MAWTPTTFKAAYLEFAEVPDAAVLDALTVATAGNDVRMCGEARLDRMIALDAADALSTGPFGQQARLDPKSDGRTTYRVQWERLARECAGGPIAIGQTP